MASKAVQNLRNFDWDDTALINAYNEGLKQREMQRKGKKVSANKENVESHPKWWKNGDHCQAVYSADGMYYEAKVMSVDRDRVTVEFLGYGDQETVYGRTLKPSAGKKARRRQKKDASTGVVSVSDSEVTTTDCDGESQKSGRHYPENPPTHHQASNYNYGSTDAYAPPPTAHTAIPQQQVPSVSHHHGATCCAPPFLPHGSYPLSTGLPAPPIPQCPGLPANSSTTAMLVSWYMAGYYTGLHQNQQKDSQCTLRCCGHANRCCH